MYYSSFYIRDGNTRIKNMVKGFTDETLLKVYKQRLVSPFIDICMGICELQFMIDSYYEDVKGSIESLAPQINIAISRLVNAKDCNELKTIAENVNNTIDPICEEYDYELFKQSNIYNCSKRDFGNLSGVNMEIIEKYINMPQRKVNIINPFLNSAESLTSVLGRDFPQSETYAVYTPDCVPSHNVSINHIIKNGLSGSKISNNAFDIMVFYPKIDYLFDSTNYSNVYVKSEKRSFMNCIKYLRPDGIVIMFIPFFRLYKDTCVLLAKNLKDITVRKTLGDNFDSYGYVAVIGRKANNTKADKEAYSNLRRTFNYGNIKKVIDEPDIKYNLPEFEIPINTFRNFMLDADDVRRLMESSDVMDTFFKQNIKAADGAVSRPLLPFNVGQIGLVLTSGCLDGIVDEGDNKCHLIKGRVYKQERNSNKTTRKFHEECRTKSHNVQISMFLPDGTYKTL